MVLNLACTIDLLQACLAHRRFGSNATVNWGWMNSKFMATNLLNDKPLMVVHHMKPEMISLAYCLVQHHQKNPSATAEQLQACCVKHQTADEANKNPLPACTLPKIDF